ncbi:MAG: ABC transporter ATP-binding protein [Candidatus Kerfeldbacteria bacterium]
MIRIENLSKTYTLKGKQKVIALKNLNLDVEKGEIIGLLGTNGAGKTTTLKLLTTLLYPSSGTAYIDGMDIRKDTKRIRKRIGVVFGGKMIYHRITGRDNLKFYGRIYNVRNLDKAIDELVEFFNLTDRIDTLVETYSTGMKAKLALMRGLIHNPPIILLDEPTLGLDPGTSVRLRKRIRQLKDMGKTIFLCTHYLHEAEELCDRIAIIHKGEMVSIDTPQRLREKIIGTGSVGVVFSRPEDAERLKAEFDMELKGQEAFVTPKNGDTLNTTLQKILALNLPIKHIHTAEPTLEDVFLELTKK